ncbi:MAG: coaE, partial [Ramlibacter sp.]|uniref:dephospho-CoA kinase n=1 Tax=Ramlibacter sp. TaxID=1917967 RepID=UPI00260F1893
DGALDRVRMREAAYARPEARRELEQIIHPLVGLEIARQVEVATAADARCIVFDIPLLVESGRWRAQLDRVLVVDCTPETQVARVVARSALQPGQVQAIIAAQAPRALRLAAADLVICNEGLTLEALRHEVEQAARTFGL